MLGASSTGERKFQRRAAALLGVASRETFRVTFSILLAIASRLIMGVISLGAILGGTRGKIAIVYSAGYRSSMETCWLSADKSSQTRSGFHDPRLWTPRTIVVLR